MGFRFWRRVRIAPGLTFNLSKGGASISLGPPGAKLTVGSSGARATAGIPGTGLFYTEKLGGGRPGRRRRSRSGAVPSRAASPAALELGFFDRLLKPEHEEHFVDALRALAEGDRETAWRQAAAAERGADPAWLAGILAIERGEFGRASAFFERAWEERATLGDLLRAYGIELELRLPVTEEVYARIAADERGLLLARIEVAQRQGDRIAAIEWARQLYTRSPADPVVRLSLAELLVDLDAEEPSQAVCQEVVRLAQDVENDSEIHAALLLHGAVALAGLGLYVAARDQLTTVLRRQKGRSEDLLRAARYQRARVYESLGEARRARSDLERLYADDPDHADVAARLGLA